MAENLITEEEITAYAPNLDLTKYSSATISGMISRASEKVRELCNVEGFFKTAVTNERERAQISPNGDLVISFKRRPVQDGDVTALRLVGSDLLQNLELTSNGSRIYFIEDPKTYMIYPSNFLIAHGKGLLSLDVADLFYEVDYIGGYATDIADIPPTLKEATTLMIRSMLSTENINPAGVSSFSQGSVSMNFGSGGKNAHVMEAEALLSRGSYIRRVI